VTTIAKNNGAFQFGAFQVPGFQVYVPLTARVIGGDGAASRLKRDRRREQAGIDHDNEILMLFARTFMERQRWVH
jgi:hypothetical protein